MKTQLALVFSVLATAASLADVGDNITSLTTLSGKTYRGVLIAEVNPDGVLFRHSAGAGKVLFSDLPSDVRQSLGFDSKKLETYEKDLAARRERERLALIERDKEVAKAQATAFTAAAAQANVVQAQYALAASQQSSASNYGLGYPVVWGLGGGYGWYTDRIPSPSYGGRAFYKVKRQVGITGGGPRISSADFAENRCRPTVTAYHSIPAGPGRTPHHVPYSGNYSGTSAYTNGVPALNASFVPSHSAARPPVMPAAPARSAPPAGRGR